jgi:hypothetical protein
MAAVSPARAARNGFDWTDRYPSISEAVAALRALQPVVDGEAVWCEGNGLAIFDKLHSRAHDRQVVLYAFDLLELPQGWPAAQLVDQGGAISGQRESASRLKSLGCGSAAFFLGRHMSRVPSPCARRPTTQSPSPWSGVPSRR